MAKKIHGNFVVRKHRYRAKETAKYVRCGRCGARALRWCLPLEDLPRGYAQVWRCRCGALASREDVQDRAGPVEAPNVQSDWRPWVCEHFEHNPVTVRSRQHYKQLLKHYKVTNGWE